MVSLAVDKIGNKTFENNEQMISFGSTEVFDADVGSTVVFAGSTSEIMFVGSPNELDTDVGIPVAFSGSTSVNFGSPKVFDADVGDTVAFSGSTSVNFGSPDVFDADFGNAVTFAGSTSVFYESRIPHEFARSTGVFIRVEKINVVASTGSEVMERDKLKKTKKLKQNDFEQERVLERVAQTPLILAGAYDTHDSMGPVNNELNHGSNENSESANLND